MHQCGKGRYSRRHFLVSYTGIILSLLILVNRCESAGREVVVVHIPS
jgi:hypothetical protein